MRLEKFLATAGVASRRDAKTYILAGRVTVNDNVVWIPGTRIAVETDEVRLDGKRIKGEPRKIYLMLNKPAGYLTTTRDERGRKTVMDLVNDVSERVFPVGRLDFDTEGLLLLTNDGAFARKIMHPSSMIDKIYAVRVKGHPSDKAISLLRQGIEIDGVTTAPAEITQTQQDGGSTQFRVVIHEGKKRQIRRMFHAIGHDVTHLKRIQVGSLRLGDLPTGRYRFLSPTEIAALMQ